MKKAESLKLKIMKSHARGLVPEPVDGVTVWRELRPFWRWVGGKMVMGRRDVATGAKV